MNERDEEEKLILEDLDNIEGNDELPNRAEVAATTLQIIEAGENLPQMVFDNLGENVSRAVLKGKNSIEICMEERGFTVIPETGALLFPINQTTKTEYLLRAPWGVHVNSFDKSFMSLKLTPNLDINHSHTTNHEIEDPEDREIGMTRRKLRREPFFDPDSVLNEKHAVVRRRDFGRMKGLVAAGIKKGLQDIDSVHNFNELSPLEIVDMYKQMYKGPVNADTKAGVAIVQESLQSNAISPEEVSIKKEPLFNAEVDYQDGNPLTRVMRPDTNIAIKYIIPHIDRINEAITRINEYNEYRIFRPIDKENIVASLLYKNENRNDPTENLTPLLLSPDVSILKGKTGIYRECTIVIMQKEGKWETGIFSNVENEDLGERIDKWYASIG